MIRPFRRLPWFGTAHYWQARILELKGADRGDAGTAADRLKPLRSFRAAWRAAFRPRDDRREDHDRLIPLVEAESQVGQAVGCLQALEQGRIAERAGKRIDRVGHEIARQLQTHRIDRRRLVPKAVIDGRGPAGAGATPPAPAIPITSMKPSSSERTDGVCQVVSQRHLAQHIDRTLAIDHDRYASDPAGDRPWQRFSISSTPFAVLWNTTAPFDIPSLLRTFLAATCLAGD